MSTTYALIAVDDDDPTAPVRYLVDPIEIGHALSEIDWEELRPHEQEAAVKAVATLLNPTCQRAQH